jgi:hypothetical protein
MKTGKEVPDMAGEETTDRSTGTEMTDRSMEDKEAEGLFR